MPIKSKEPFQNRPEKRNSQQFFWKQAVQYFLNFLILVVVCFVIHWLLTIGLFHKEIVPIVHWIKRTSYPDGGLYIVCFLFACLLWTFFTYAQEIKIENGPLAVVIKALQSVKYFFTLPVSVLFSFSALSCIALFLIRPACEPPIVNIEAGKPGEVKSIEPQFTIHLNRGSEMTVKIISQVDEEEIQCNWSLRGNIFQNQLPNSTCINTVFLTNGEGTGIVTVDVTKDWCDAKRVIPVFVSTK